MSDEKQSPGPWDTLENPGGQCPVAVYSRDGVLVAKVRRRVDAALIADAPAMLELLREAEVFVRDAAKIIGGNAADGYLKRLGDLLDKHGMKP